MPLTLGRKVGEQIIIGKEIVVTVLDVRNGKVKLGIVAPPHIDIHRPEAKRKAA